MRVFICCWAYACSTKRLNSFSAQRFQEADQTQSPMLDSVNRLSHKERCGPPSGMLRKVRFQNGSSAPIRKTVSGDDNQLSAKTCNLFKPRPYEQQRPENTRRAGFDR